MAENDRAASSLASTSIAADAIDFAPPTATQGVGKQSRPDSAALPPRIHGEPPKQRRWQRHFFRHPASFRKHAYPKACRPRV